MSAAFPLSGRLVGAGAASIILAAAMFALVAAPVAADHTGFVVNSTGDDGDFDPGDGSCRTTENIPFPSPEPDPLPEAECTLRAAIEEANAHVGRDFIEFNIPADQVADDGFYRITPATELPTITEEVQITGETQPGAAQNTDPSSWNGSAIVAIVAPATPVAGADGLSIGVSGVQINGLTIAFFDGDGIEVAADAGLGLEGSQVHDNAGHGVLLNDGSFVLIGSTNPEGRNRIFQNGGAGVAVTGPTSNPGTVSHIRNNLIYDNQQPSIDLGADGETDNDAGDADAGPNGLQNHPSLTSAFADAGRVTIDGSLASLAQRDYAIDFFLTDACGGVSGVTDSGEGHYYLGSSDVQTNADGSTGFRATLSLPDGIFSGRVSATASGPQFLAGGQQGTSEFSECVNLQQGPPPQITPNPATQQPLPSSTTAGPDETVSQEIPPEGGTVGTDVEGDGATAADPVETSVTSPNGGTVTIQEADVSEPEPTGYSFFGQQVNITALAATPGNPLVLTFLLDSSLLTGTAPGDVTVFREGVPLPVCTDPGVASPDPCLESSTILANGDLELVALTSAASAWNFGIADDAAAPVASDGAPVAPSATREPRVPNTAGPGSNLDLSVPAGLLLAASGGLWLVTRRLVGVRR